MVKKVVVIASLEDVSGQRCVDILCRNRSDWSFVECRRDPEDAHGWRRLTEPAEPWLPDRCAAEAAAREKIQWLEEEPNGGHRT